MRLILTLGVLLVLVAPAAAQDIFRVDTEDAYVNQCRSGLCSTLQVNRSTFSNGAVQTVLFFSAYDTLGERR